MIPKVFLPQIALRYDDKKGSMVPCHDFSEATRFGQLVPVLDSDDDPIFLEKLTSKITEALEGFGCDDFLVAVGDPTVIAVCAGVILRKQNSLKMLKWDRKIHSYIPLEVKP